MSNSSDDDEHYIVPPEVELRRLREGPAPGIQPNGAFLDRIIAHCPGNVEVILSKCREVLEAVVSHTRHPMPSLAEWQIILPQWFVSQCQDEPDGDKPPTVRDDAWEIFQREHSIAKTLAYIRQHRQEFDQLKADEIEHQDDPWPLSAWLFWFEPQERWWWWWDAELPDPNTLVVTVEAAEYLYPAEALLWLLRAAGATFAEKEI